MTTGSEVYDVKPGDRVCLLPRLSISELIALTGLVRSLCAGSVQVMLLAKRAHARAVRNLYGNVPGVRFKFVESWDELYTPPEDRGAGDPRGDADAGDPRDTVLGDLARLEYRVVPLPSFREACPYRMLGLDPKAAEYEFQLQRNLGDERALHESIVRRVGTVYAVVHDDPARLIRRQLLPQNMPIVDVRDPAFRTANPFDWITAIDRAVQFHGIDSCFMLMADCLGLRARKYLHAYASPAASSASSYRDVVTIQ
jgi:hypothetical protein